MCISSMTVCIFRAKTMFEYCCNVYVFITELTVIFNYSHQMFMIINILKINEKIDELVELCKYSKEFTSGEHF